MMIKILLFVLCLVNSVNRSTSHNVDGMRGTLKEDLQLDKLINKSPVKSIHTKFGYIVDCIDIDKQPAFDHPLLKNHKLQRKPSFQRIVGKNSVNISRTKPIFELEKDQCPRGTLPVRRTTKDDQIRAKSFINNHMLTQRVPGSYTKFGYIVDCIDIDKQPAFDHPLLKNHKLQRKPSFQRIVGKNSVNISRTKPIFELEKDQCPRGTLPVRRTRKDDQIRAKSFINNHMLTQRVSGSYAAGVNLEGTYFYGVSGTVSIYNPKVDHKDQSSTVLMWVQNGPDIIGVGWHVAPRLYNDNKTHLFAAWTADNFNTTGCYNLLCPGFVQTHNTITPGQLLRTTSVSQAYEISLSISQDPITKNWWFNIREMSIGYFPAALFSNLTSADRVGWAGWTTTSVGIPSPPMGSGFLPDGCSVDACYFSNIVFQDDSRTNKGPAKDAVHIFTDKPKCYGSKYCGDELRGTMGFLIQFGGPGGNCED